MESSWILVLLAFFSSLSSTSMAHPFFRGQGRNDQIKNVDSRHFLARGTDCRLYYVREGEYSILMACPRGKLFDIKRRICDDEEVVKCERNYSDFGKDKQVYFSKVKFDCPFPFGTFPHPTDCSKYYLCVFNKATLKKCSSSERYDVDKKECAKKNTVDCSDRDGSGIKDDDDKEEVFKCPFRWGAFPHNKYCNKYHLCMNSKSSVMTCSSSELFDANTKECEDRKKVDCGSRIDPKATVKPTTSTKTTTFITRTPTVVTESEISTASPREEESSAATPKEEEASTASPSEEEASTASPREEESSTASPKEEEASTASPKDEEASTASPREEEVSTASKGEDELSSSSPGEEEFSTASPSEEEASTASSREDEVSTPSKGEDEVSSTSPGEEDVSTTSPDEEVSGTSIPGNDHTDHTIPDSSEESSSDIATKDSSSESTDATRTSSSSEPQVTSEREPRFSSLATDLPSSEIDRATSSTPSATTEVEEEFVCLRKKGQFPHKKDCSLYHSCRGGKATLVECPPGLLFDTNIGLCFNEKQVDCGERKRPGEGEVTTENYNSSPTGSQISEDSTSTRDYDTEKPSQTTRDYDTEEPSETTRDYDTEEPSQTTRDYDTEEPSETTRDYDTEEPSQTTRDYDTEEPSETTRDYDTEEPFETSRDYDTEEPSHSTTEYDTKDPSHETFLPDETTQEKQEPTTSPRTIEVSKEDFHSSPTDSILSSTPSSLPETIETSSSSGSKTTLQPRKDCDGKDEECTTDDGKEETIACPSSFGIFPHPTDPQKFIQCDNFTVHIISCPGKLIFDPVHKVCSWPKIM